MTAAVQLRIPSHLWLLLWEEVRRPAIREPVVFALVSQGQTPTGTLVLVRELIFPPSTAFVTTTDHGAKWTAAYNIALLNEALERGLGIIIFHYHPTSTQVRASLDDEQSARKLLPVFQSVIPGRPHGAVVLGKDSVAGQILLPGASAPIDHFQLRFFTETITTLPRNEANASDMVLHRRRPLVDGVVSKILLRNASVAVVGLSGGGSQIVTQLAGLGVGEIIAIDGQRLTRDNLVATDVFGWVDAMLRRRKAAALRSRVWWINRRVQFTVVNHLVPQKATIAALKRADVIVGCVNNLTARADLQEIAWRYCIPYVDIGLGLYPLDPDDDLSEIANISGNVFRAMPGGPCLWCTGFLSEQKLQLEAGGANRSYLRSNLAKHKKQEPCAHVASFNRVLAGLAMHDVLQLILGYSPKLAVRKQYDGFTGTVSEVVIEKTPSCAKCSSILAAGDPLWN